METKYKKSPTIKTFNGIKYYLHAAFHTKMEANKIAHSHRYQGNKLVRIVQSPNKQAWLIYERSK